MILFALFATMALSSSQPADPRSANDDPDLAACLAAPSPSDGGEQVTACYESAVVRADAAIVAADKALAAEANKRRLGQELANGMTGFRRYRDSWCAFEHGFEGDPGARTATGLMCRYEVSRFQLYRLTHAN